MDGSILKVLSIDFDYIMAPCIKLYNDLCGGKENPTVVWNHIEHERNIEPFLHYDADSLLKIAMIIKENVKNGAKLIPINEHQEIIKYLSDCRVELTNIDFHHDVIYNINELSEITDMHKYNCANWVYYLYSNNQLESYTWLKAPQSDMLNFDTDFKIDKILTKSDFGQLNYDFDLVFFCLSPQWVPYKFHHLYNLIIELCKEDINERTICSE